MHAHRRFLLSFRNVWIVVLACGAAQAMKGSVFLSSYSFNAGAKPTVSFSSESLSPPYKLRVKILNVPGYPDGYHAVTAWNNQAETLEAVPSPGVYSVELYGVQYASDLTTVLSQTTHYTFSIQINQAINGVGWQLISCPTSSAPGNTVSVYATVQNSGNTIWDSNYHIELKDSDGNHLYYGSIGSVPPGGQIIVQIPVTLPTTAGHYTWGLTAMQYGVEYFGGTQNFTILANRSPVTSPMSGSTQSATSGQTVYISSTTTDADGNLTAQVVDYFGPGVPVWTEVPNNAWSGAPAATNSLSNVAFQVYSPGVYTVRGYGTDVYGFTSPPQYWQFNVTTSGPAIASQNGNVSASLGGEANFFVTSSGTGLSYQWYKDGGPIAGATAATLALTNVQPSNEGVYTVRVTNSFGFVTSTPSILSIVSNYTFSTLAGSPQAYGSADGTGSAARFSSPMGGAVSNAGDLYVVDTGNSTIRKVSPAGTVSTFAGAAGQASFADGTGAAARFYYPFGIAVDSSGNLFVADTGNNALRKITPGGTVSTVVAGLGGPSGVAVSANGTVYIAESATSIIRKYAQGALTLVAGISGTRGSSDGPGASATFNGPQDVTLDSSGNIYVADEGNDTIRKIDTTGNVTTLAGLAGNYGFANGAGSAARFYSPMSVATDASGMIYVDDYGNHVIRRVTPSGAVSILAGQAGTAGSTDGTATNTRFSYPGGVTLDEANTVFVVDMNNETIRKGVPPATPPVIVAQPVSSVTWSGQSVNFAAVLGGTAPFTYQWLKNGSPITSATASSYSLTSVQATDAADYSVVVTNALGSATSAAARLTVISSQPQNQSGVVGGNVTFSVTVAAVGGSTPTYQWRVNGTNIATGTGATLSLTNLQLTDGGSYDVVVSNGAVSGTSSAATLTVTAAVDLQLKIFRPQ